MNLRDLLTHAVMPAALLGVTFAVAVYGQQPGPNSPNVAERESLHEAEEQTGQAVQNPYEGTKTAANDTAITAKVKTELDRAKVTGGSAGSIRVTTTTGIVTLKGTVPTVETLAQAELLARSTQGVRNVVNELQVKSVVE